MIEALEFIVARYNYWIVIILMMTGLYTVIARGNLVKKIIGLNVFQTSVFIFYITIGKITGGTAPIYVPGDMEARTDHGSGHGSEHGGSHDVPVDTATTSIHESTTMTANDLSHAGLNTDARPISGNGTDNHVDVIDSLHSTGKAVNSDLVISTESTHFQVEDHVADAVPHSADATAPIIDAVYSNPLPHVLILTAIVVGVATTAVGLALAVRIREAYGTIEEDELEALDNIAEFGEPMPSVKAAS